MIGARLDLLRRTLYDDSPKIRELYKDYEMIEVERLNGINNREGTNRENKMFKELLIANYPIQELFKNIGLAHRN